jgi:dTMP kinase
MVWRYVMEEGLFITIEGTDGSGKTTQIALMEEYLIRKGYKVVLTREPGGTGISEKIRSIILDTANTNMGIMTEMLLYAAARAQLVSEVIKPALESGKIVICDRFVDSTYAYQGFGRGINLKQITDINRSALDGIMPDITFFFDLSPEIALRRRVNASVADRIEKEKMDFHMNVYKGYKKLSALYPERIKTINCNRGIEAISIEIKEILDEILEEE